MKYLDPQHTLDHPTHILARAICSIPLLCTSVWCETATFVDIKPLISFPLLCSDTAVTYLKMDNNMVSTTQLLPPVSSETNGDQAENFTLSVLPWIV